MLALSATVHLRISCLPYLVLSTSVYHASATAAFAVAATAPVLRISCLPYLLLSTSIDHSCPSSYCPPPYIMLALLGCFAGVILYMYKTFRFSSDPCFCPTLEKKVTPIDMHTHCCCAIAADPAGSVLVKIQDDQLIRRVQGYQDDQLTRWAQGCSGRPAYPVGSGLLRSGSRAPASPLDPAGAEVVGTAAAGFRRG